MAGNGALDLSIRIVGKVDPSLAKTISQVKGLTGSLAGEMRGVNSMASTVTNVLGVVGKAGLALGATLTGAVAAGIQKTTNEAVKLEAQMAPVMRYVDGLADSSGKASDQMSENGKTYAQNYADMENYIQRLSMEIPRTTEQLSTMSAALGQSGKDVDEQTTSGILRDTAVAATAMDLEDRTAGDYMAKWEVSFTKKDENGNKVNYSHDDVMRLMNQINYLGANNATTAAEIASSVNKSASVGQLAGVDPQQPLLRQCRLPVLTRNALVLRFPESTPTSQRAIAQPRPKRRCGQRWDSRHLVWQSRCRRTEQGRCRKSLRLSISCRTKRSWPH